MSENNTVLKAMGIHRIFPSGMTELHVLKGVDFELKRGEVVSLLGSSGSGKSTLLHILAGLDTPTDGTVMWGDTNIFALKDRVRSYLRNANLGFIFQFHHLFPELTALENVMLPLLIGGSDKSAARKKAEGLLERFGLSDRAEHFPSQLSGGEAQRVAVARAIVSDPQILLADEPSGNLDSENKKILHGMLLDISAQFGTAILIATHNIELAMITQRILYLTDGRLSDRSPSGGIVV